LITINHAAAIAPCGRAELIASKPGNLRIADARLCITANFACRRGVPRNVAGCALVFLKSLARRYRAAPVRSRACNAMQEEQCPACKRPMIVRHRTSGTRAEFCGIANLAFSLFGARMPTNPYGRGGTEASDPILVAFRTAHVYLFKPAVQTLNRSEPDAHALPKSFPYRHGWKPLAK
jgi:hypothetical protein